jgi:hypothetical protein
MTQKSIHMPIAMEIPPQLPLKITLLRKSRSSLGKTIGLKQEIQFNNNH